MTLANAGRRATPLPSVAHRQSSSLPLSPFQTLRDCLTLSHSLLSKSCPSMEHDQLQPEIPWSEL